MPQDYLISASILAADFGRLAEEIQAAEAGGADWIHIDVMDGHFVPNLTMGPAIVRACRQATDLPLDVHLMIERPQDYLGAFADAGADSLTVHLEAATHLHRALESIRQLSLSAGVALNPATPVEAASEVLQLADILLLMTVDPGFAGQRFIEEVLSKVRQVRAWQSAGRTAARIQVDGGIDAHTAPLAAAAGAQVFVAAKAVFRYPQGIEAGIAALRAALETVPMGG